METVELHIDCLLLMSENEGSFPTQDTDLGELEIDLRRGCVDCTNALNEIAALSRLRHRVHMETEAGDLRKNLLNWLPNKIKMFGGAI